MQTKHYKGEWVCECVRVRVEPYPLIAQFLPCSFFCFCSKPNQTRFVSQKKQTNVRIPWLGGLS